MDSTREKRIEQIRETLRKERRSLVLWAVVALLGYAVSAFLGPRDVGWVAFVVAVAVAASFVTIVTAVNIASWELEANLLEGPRID